MKRNHLAPIAGLMLASACIDSAPFPTEPTSPASARPDHIAGGDLVFAFLAPLGDEIAPVGVFDDHADPTAQICSYAGGAWSEADCASPVEEYTLAGKGPRKLVIVGEAYEAEWRTKPNLNQTLTYRIRVLVAGIEVGFIDAGFDETMAGPDYYVLSRREALPIRFWLGAVESEPEPDPELSYTSSPNAAIPDNNETGITDAIEDVSGCSDLQGISVRMDIEHPWIGDLIVRLTSPGATTVTLHDLSGGSADNIIGTYPDDLVPAESLDAFVGEDANGTWTLSVSDNSTSDAGTLREWGVDLVCGQP